MTRVPPSRLLPVPVTSRNSQSEPATIPGEFTFFDVLAHKSRVWKIKKVAEAELVVLEARRQVATARLQVQTAEAEVEFQLERQLGEHTITLTRLFMERERLRQELNPPPPTAIALPEPTTPVPGLEVDLSDRQIEALALRAVIRFGSLRGEPAEQAWSAWKQELRQRFPQNLVAEIEQRADALRAAAE